MRKEIILYDNWLFHKGDIDVPKPVDKGPVYVQSKNERKTIGPASYLYFDVPDSFYSQREMRNEGWRRVNLPHDYIVGGIPDSSYNNALGYLKYENAWYRKHFNVDEKDKDKRFLLRFEGIAGKSTVYLNGVFMYHNFSSYNSFEIDITNNVFFDKENVIAVYVNTDEFEGWWYQGGGIYRDVTLVITEPVAIDLYGVYAPAHKADGNNWNVDIETTVVNDLYEDVSVEAKSVILDSENKEIGTSGTSLTVPLREKGVLKYQIKVNSPKLWDTDNPNLYTVKTTLSSGDEVSIRIGFRTVEADAENGLLINGKKIVIKGVCAHQDFGLTGLAVPDNIARYKIKMMKQMGANGFRTTHYQNSTVNMDAFDELGFLVLNETRWFETSPEAFAQLETLVKRDRNRPSVIMWSTGNEEPSFATEVGRKIHKAIAAKIRKLDPDRLITAAQDRTPEKSTIYADSDVIGINYNLGNYDIVHKLYPNKAVFASECCATGTTRDWNLPSNNEGRIRDKDRDTNDWFLGREKTWKFLMERPYVFGGYQWDAVEHRGEAQWPCICSKSGAIDLFLQKKGAFYQNQSHWLSEPMVHIVPHWNFAGLEGEIIPVTVYTNCDELELFLNGKSLGRLQIEKYGHGEWNVPYTAGELKVIGYRDGKVVAEDIRKTTKKAVKLSLRLENEITFNGRDMALFTCECLDEDGLTVPDATEFVSFYSDENAKIIGTGSDNCDHTSVTLTQRKMYAGKITVGVVPKSGADKFELYAKSDNCAVAKITVKCN